MINLPPVLIVALDAWIRCQPEPKPTREQAIEMAVADWLVGIGALPLDEVADFNKEAVPSALSEVRREREPSLIN
jgi:hypothetical protein